jgi:4-aminobutyrate aminotransferase-like enzyme
MSYEKERAEAYDREIMELLRCTRGTSTEWPTEERINNIGQNGPTGEHYMNKYQRKLTSPLVRGVDGFFVDMEGEVIIDVYDVLDAFGVTNPATAHAVKKLLFTGGRGLKDWETDHQEAIDSLERAKSFPPVPF